MEIVYGKTREILPVSDGETSGFVIDGGMEVHFPKESAQRVAAVVSLGSRLEICGNQYRGPSGDPRLDAQFITNLDSNRSVNLHDAPPMDKPEMPPSSSPTSAEAASLAPPNRDTDGEPSDSLQLEELIGVSDASPRPNDAASAEFSHQAPTTESVLRPRQHRHAHGEAAARSIELAYDGIHRAQALLAYITIVDIRNPDVGQLFDESKYTYQQALASYQKQDFAVAGEFAAASGELSRSVELIASRTLRVESNSPTLVPSPPQRQADVLNAAETQSSLTRVGKLLARIHWLVQNGTLPFEDREQVRRIVSWSDVLYSKGQHSWKAGSFAEASYFMSAAEAVAHSAEHICKQDYIPHVSAAN